MKKLLCYLSVSTLLGMSGIVFAATDTSDKPTVTDQQLNIHNNQLTDDSDVPASYDEDSTTKDSSNDSTTNSATNDSATTQSSTETPKPATPSDDTSDEDSGDMRKNGNTGNN